MSLADYIVGRVKIADLEQGPDQSGNHTQRQYEIDEVSRSEYYERIVEGNLKHRPWLDILHQFMDPYAAGFAVNPKRRMHYFDIKVIHISKSGDIESLIKCLTPAEFKEAISEAEGKERSGTIIIAKDLSRAMIDALGMKYDIEPEFFASHLGGTESFGMGSWESPTVRPHARAPNLLPDYLRKAPYYIAQYRRPYHIEGGKYEVFKLRTSESNYARGTYVLNDDLPDTFAAENISVYKKPGSNIGIILTDQLLSKVLPATYIHSPITILDDDHLTLGAGGRSHQVSTRRELLNWLQRLPAQERKGILHSPKALALQPALKLVERSSSMFLIHVQYIMSRMLNRFCDDRFPNSIPFFLAISRALHRHINLQQKLLRSAISLASLRGVGPGDGLGSVDVFAEQIRDFEELDQEMARSLKGLEEDVRFLASIASIQEGKVVGWVSKFAALFLPVSLLATILTITDPGYMRWAILGGLSFPFVLISVFFMFFWKPPHVNTMGY